MSSADANVPSISTFVFTMLITHEAIQLGHINLVRFSTGDRIADVFNGLPKDFNQDFTSLASADSKGVTGLRKYLVAHEGIWM